MSSVVPSPPPRAGTLDGATTRDGTHQFSEPPIRCSLPDGAFLPEAHTMEVSVRSSDHGAPSTVPSVVERAVECVSPWPSCGESEDGLSAVIDDTAGQREERP